jgi:hypothetical protein
MAIKTAVRGKNMDLFASLLVYGASVPEPGLSEEEINSTIRYINKGRDY